MTPLYGHLRVIWLIFHGKIWQKVTFTIIFPMTLTPIFLDSSYNYMTDLFKKIENKFMKKM